MKILPDLLTFTGLFCLGYGLYLFKPWVSYTVVGFLVLIGGTLLGRAEFPSGEQQ